jgi:hypothetical protein
MYQTTISAKIALIFLAGWEAFMVNNVFVQWVITAFVLIGFIMWLYSYSLTIEKKNLILASTSKEEAKKWMKIAKNIRLRLDIDKIIFQCFVIAVIIVTLVVVISQSN